MLTVPDKINWHGKFVGIDHRDQCSDQQHFDQYSKVVQYDHNSKGFRDEEWPSDLQNVVWCVGDSFTVGLGQPQTETWPYLLQKRTGRRCLNIGENGASNDFIATRSKQIIKEHPNCDIVIMWSYFNRRLKWDIDAGKDENVPIDPNDWGYEADIKNFADNFLSVCKLQPKAIHLLVPNALTFMKQKYNKKIFITLLKKIKVLNNGTVEEVNWNIDQFKKILFYSQQDYARDGHHFDIKTSQSIVGLVSELLE